MTDINNPKANRYRDLVEKTSDWLWETDCNAQYTYVSPKIRDLLGYAPEEVIGKTPFDLMPPEEASRIAAFIQPVFENAEAFAGIENVNIHKDGHLVVLETSGVPIFDANGNLNGYRGVDRDISDRKETEDLLSLALDQLRESEERYHELVDHMWTCVVIYEAVDGGRNFVIKDINRAVEEIDSVVKEDTIGRRVTDVFPGVEAFGLFDVLKRVWKTGVSEHLPLAHYHDGRIEGWRENYVYRLSSGEVIAVYDDVSARKKSEEALAEAQRLSHVGSWDWDLINDVVIWSDETYRIFGIEDRIGSISLDIAAVESMVHPDDRQTMQFAINGTLSNKRAEYAVNFRLVRPNGEIRNAQVFGKASYLTNGTPARLVGSVQDVTERTHNEEALQIAKSEAELANRAKSEFLASMSHELRTPLNAILGFGQLLQQHPNNPLNTKQHEYVESILAAGSHLLDLINDVLDLSKIEADHVFLSLDAVDATKIIDECFHLAMPMGASRQITLINNLIDVKGIILRTDERRFKQSVLNLLSNAIKYNVDGGTVTLDGYTTDDDYFHIDVRDTGVGIADEDRDRVFQMFHRIDADPMVTREGTGIGLTVTKLLVERMAGRIGFDSTLHKGSTFWIELPLLSNEQTLVWSDKLRTGVDVIDDDHEILFALLNKLTLQPIEEREVKAIISELLAYARDHFQREETIMEFCAYPDLTSHRRLHRQFTQRIEKYAERKNSNGDMIPLQQLRQYLRTWLVDHNMNADVALARYLNIHRIDVPKALAD